jgi:hypothetical protein
MTAPAAGQNASAGAGEPPVARLAQADAPRGARPGSQRAGRPPAAPEVTERFSRTVRLGAKEGFELATGVGQVVVTGTSGDDVRIDAVKRVRNANSDAGRALLQSVNIRITERGGLIEALTEFSGRREPVFVDYAVSLPTRASVSIKTIGGVIRVTNVKGELRAEAASGDIVLSSVGSIRRAKTLAGNVTISDTEGDEVIAETTVGTLQLRNVNARTVELGTVSGNMVVTDAQCERCTLKTLSGNIEFVGPLTRGGRYELQSNSGNIRLVPTGAPNFDLEARTFGGQLLTEFELKPDTTSPARQGTLRGSYGEEAGAILSLASFSGNVSIVRK